MRLVADLFFFRGLSKDLDLVIVVVRIFPTKQCATRRRGNEKTCLQHVGTTHKHKLFKEDGLPLVVVLGILNNFLYSIQTRLTMFI